MERKYAEFAATKACELLAIDSPSGYTRKAATWVKEAFEALGFAAKITTKGGVLADLGGADKDDALFLQAHTDTLGAMVAEIKANGRLQLTPLGGLRAENAETENVRVHTRTGKIIEGTVQLCNASVHVNGEYGETKRTFDTVEAVLDEDVKTAEATRALGIEVGDIVCLEPRTRITSSGYIKSRFLDDKLSAVGNVNIIQLGGVVHKKSLSVRGTSPLISMEEFSCSKLFIGADGINEEYGVTNSNLEEAQLNREMMKAASKTIVLVDSSKFSRKGFGRICPLSQIHTVVTDGGIHASTVRMLEEQGVEVIIAE